jgi:multiple sugar transport system permease protein
MAGWMNGQNNDAPAGLSRLLTYAVLGLWSLVCLVPIYWALIASIKPPVEFVGASHYLPFIDFRPSLHAWRNILVHSSDDTLLRFVNSLVVAATSTMLTVLVGFAAAYGLTRFHISLPFARAGTLVGVTVAAGAAVLDGLSAFWVSLAWLLVCLPLVISEKRFGRHALLGRIAGNGFFAIIIATRILPPLVTVLPLYYLFQKAGLYDTRAGLILAYTASNLPIAVWLLRGFIADISPDTEEAAQLDGASRLRIFFTIAFPLCRTAIAATAAVVFLFCWNEYLISVYLTADRSMTVPPFLASQMTSREQMAAAEPDDYARLAVVVVLMLAPLLALTPVFRRVLNRIGDTQPPSGG